MILFHVEFTSYWKNALNVNSMELSPGETNSYSATYKIPSSISQNPKVHYSVHKSPPLAPTVSLMNAVIYTYLTLHGSKVS
jgi:hypothetical protein